MAAADKSKKVTIFVSRNLTLNRKGQDPVALTAGANVVDADVAEHPFVKAHAVGGNAEVADLAAELQAAKDALAVATKRADDAEAKVAELQAVIDAAAAMGAGNGQATGGKSK